MDILLINLQYIFALPELLVTFISSGVLGMCCLVAALNLTIKRDFKTRWLKYLLTTCCISFTSAFFIMLMIPALFAEVSSYFIVTKSLIFILVWIALAELIHFHSKNRSGKVMLNRGKIYQR